MSIISKFNNLTKLDQQLISDIKSFYLTKYHLIYVTKQHSVIQYKLSDSETKTLIANQVIVKLDCSDYHYIALTDTGRVYSWGNNWFGQLGYETVPKSYYEPKLITDLCDEFITDIRCGKWHSLVLTREANVFAFGWNIDGQCSNTDTIKQLIPIKLGLTKVCAVSCGAYHSMAVTHTGEVYGWGRNSDGQLGIDAIPSQPTIPVITQIMCGNRYTLMLSTGGDIYFCGTIGDCLAHRIPKKLNSEIKYVKIGATIHCELCVALSRDSECYIFGKYGDHPNYVIVRDLRKTEFASINETFAFYSQITYETIDTLKHE